MGYFRERGIQETWRLTLRRKDRSSSLRRLRRKHGIRCRTKILVYDDGDRIILKPVTEEYVKRLQGCLKGKGALKALLRERFRGRDRQ